MDIFPAHDYAGHVWMLIVATLRVGLAHADFDDPPGCASTKCDFKSQMVRGVAGVGYGR